ncbi:MAG: fibronectin type III domain-containing protein [Saprospiraceae bacterium]|nr:fibronectin type III domain-containing protein [Saprospiraceae bacterium]
MSLNATQLSITNRIKSVLLFVVLALPLSLFSQVTPGEGTVECFAVGEGGVFVDFGGIGGNDDVEGAPGNYLNCDCVTTTTLCGVDGSAVTLDFTSFGVFAAFDWVVILDADNTAADIYPHSILVNPNNANLQLFNNADGAGDGGSENYGAGAENGVTDLAGMPTTSFSSTNPNGCLTVVFRASAVVDDSGWEALISLSSNAPHPGDNVSCSGSFSCPPPSNVEVSGILPSFATVSWAPSDSTDTYEVEFGPTGFVYGMGTAVTVNSTEIQLSGLEENTCYDVYVTAICDGNNTSSVIGPITFCTPFLNPPNTCTYTVELFDSFGDGWNGALLTMDINGVLSTFTLDNVNDDGSYEIYTFEVLDGLPLIIDYTSGAYENEVTYNINNSDNQLILADGPFPQVGEVYNELAICPDCPAVNPSSIVVENIGINTIELSWNPVGSAVDYTVEYGPSGFPVGFGLTFSSTTADALITGLNPCVSYDFYITTNCDAANGSSTQVGPISVITLPETLGDPCVYTLELFDSFGDGWNNATLYVTISGVTTTYTFFSGFSASFEFTAYANLPVTISYTPGNYENEVTYNVVDPDGNIIFSDGPFPTVGDVYEFIACPTCSGPLGLQMLDVNATNASIGWQAAAAPGNYTIEYGPLGFTLGTGFVILGSDITSATLTGLLENTYYDVYLRYACDGGELAKTLGPITFKTLFLVDVGAAQLLTPEPVSCNLGVESISFLMQNYGQNPQSLVPYFYAINGVEQPVDYPADGLFTGVVSNDSVEIVSFDLQYDFSVPGYYLIQIWTELDGDNNTSNDTLSYELITAFPLPLVEDFESGTFPTGWTSDELNPVFAPGAHNNPTWILSDNNWSSDQAFQVTTSRYGPLGPSDSLFFDYRYVNYFDGTIATILNGDMMEIQISTDCGDTFETVYIIDQSNHVPSTEFATVYIDLSAYEDMAINVRWQTDWAQGDYWVDIDNVNISGCPSTLLISGTLTDASSLGASDGSINAAPGLGVGPYSYEWDNGQTTATAVGLAAGVYTVTVMDVNGCTDVKSFTLGALVGAEELELVQHITLAPNPTMGEVLLQASINTSEPIDIEVYNMVGQRILFTQEPATNQLSTRIDLSGYPDGMYFVRLSSAGKRHIEKLVLAASRP